ncbi:MAG: hypothetical protein HYW06_13625 [Gemmatimonadetes bacterium]|nr:hypothetical protein [Gemmatimonadota bacterium]
MSSTPGVAEQRFWSLRHSAGNPKIGWLGRRKGSVRAAASGMALTVVWPWVVLAQVAVPDSVRRAAASAPLFASHGTLTLTVEAPLATIFREQQYVVQEYLVYRVLNLLTDLSFRVRLARITYVDTDAKRDTVTRYGFLIEGDEMMAARNGWQALAVPAIPRVMADPEYLALVGVFQYLIGNPDWSAFGVAPDEDECCHNTQPVGTQAGPVFSVPYDFDVTGAVYTRYADGLFRPQDRNLGIRTVRDRVYRGFCASAGYLPQVFGLFNQRREAIYALYREQAHLGPKIVEQTLKYFDEFYHRINDPRTIAKAFGATCRG